MKSTEKIEVIQKWPLSSNGAWVIDMIGQYLEDKGLDGIQRTVWFNTPLSSFGGMNSVQFVQELVKNGNAESYADAWNCVFGTAKRIFG